MRRISVALLALSLSSLLCVPAMADFVPGTYEGEVLSVGGPMKVSVEVSEKDILSIDVVEMHDSEGVADAAVDRLVPTMVESQSVAVDNVTGATLTSLFLKNAVKDALSKAGEVEGLSEAVPYLAPAQEDMEVDVVVVGGGIGGLSAAATTAQAGLKTVVVEKNGYMGGTALISDQYCLTGVTDPVVSNWKPLIEDLNAMDIPAGLAEYPGYGEDTLLTMPDNGHTYMSQLMGGLADVVERNGGLLLTETPAIALLSEEGGVYVVMAKPKGQEPFEIHAKAVILATGGFSSNKEMVAKYLPYAAEARHAGLGGNTGDAIGWVEELGGKLVSMDADVSSFYSFSPSLGFYAEFAFLTIHYVDNTGKLITEDTQYNTGSMKTFEAIGNEKFYTIISAEEIEKNGSQKDFDHMVIAGTTKKYDSIGDIAKECELPNLPATMEELGLPDGAYYASPAIAEIYGTYGGVAVDEAGHVMNTDDALISGLYACGEVTGSRDYQLTGAYAGGLGPALTMGHVTGLTVAEDAK